MSPTFATYSRSPRSANPLRVSRIDWRWCLRRNTGCPTLRPFRRAGQGIEPVPVGAARILARLHQRHRRDLTQPGPLRGELGQGDHPPLHLGVADLLPGRVAGIPQPQAVVVHHPGAAEHPRQGLLLPRRRVEAVPVPDLHDTRACHRPLTIAAEHRRGRHVVSALHVHLVFVTTYRRGVLDADMLRSARTRCGRCAATSARSCGSSTAKTITCTCWSGTRPRSPSPALVNSLKGVPARRLRPEFTGRVNRHIMHGHFWSPSYFAASCGGAPLSIIRQHPAEMPPR